MLLFLHPNIITDGVVGCFALKTISDVKLETSHVPMDGSMKWY
jgi:hypothetical protein